LAVQIRQNCALPIAVLPLYTRLYQVIFILPFTDCSQVFLSFLDITTFSTRLYSCLYLFCYPDYFPCSSSSSTYYSPSVIYISPCYYAPISSSISFCSSTCFFFLIFSSTVFIFFLFLPASGYFFLSTCDISCLFSPPCLTHFLRFYSLLYSTLLSAMLYVSLSPRYGASSGCGWRRRPPDVEGSCECIE
jgi:hypothetical protein